MSHLHEHFGSGRVVDRFDDPASGAGDWSLQRALALRESLRDALAATYDLVTALKRQRLQRRKAADAQSQLQLSKLLAGER